MSMELLDFQPKELKFAFELKKRSSCHVQLFNNSDEYVAFKVKTTTPQRYSVCPNTGIVSPKSTCDFTVTMQALQAAPPDMQCKDKFLIQSTIVPFGTTAADITPNLFTKENGKFIEENKLKVVLVSPAHSPVLSPINRALRPEPSRETSALKDYHSSGVENLPPHFVAPKLVELAKDTEVANDTEELTSKLNELELKLNEAAKTITSLSEEKTAANQARDMLQQELALRRESRVHVRVGFPLLFVCTVALISVVVGYMLHL